MLKVVADRPHLVRRVALGAYAALVVTYSLLVGIPVERVVQAGWLLVGILIAGIGRSWRRNVQVFVDWVPFIGLLVIYDQTRGIADTLGMPVLLEWPIRVDEALSGGPVPTVVLQEHLYEPGRQQWWDVVAAVVYATHFVFPWLLAAVLYVRSRTEWVWYARRVLLLSAAGLATYVLLPMTPPWMAAESGAIDADVARISAQGWSAIGLRSAQVVIERAQGDVNLVAALPSLHAGFSMLVTLAMWRFVRSRVVRVALLSYPLAMGFSLVYGGEHYLIDVLLGWGYVLAVFALLNQVERRFPIRASRFQVGLLPQDLAGPAGLVRPDKNPQPLGGLGDRARDTGSGEPSSDELGIGVAVGTGNRDE